MNKNMIIIFFLVVLAAAGYYCYEQGYFNPEAAQVEKVLIEVVCDPSQEDCATEEYEEDLAV